MSTTPDPGQPAIVADRRNARLVANLLLAHAEHAATHARELLTKVDDPLAHKAGWACAELHELVHATDDGPQRLFACRR